VTTAGIAFLPLQREHFPLLARWLAEPVVHRWWNHETSLEAVEHDFGPAVDGHEPTDVFLACVEDQPFGLIQRYVIEAYPEYLQELGSVCPVPAGALSVDYLVGEPALRGRGLGAGMVRELVRLSWTTHPEAHSVLVPVSVANTTSWKTLERAGFHRFAEGELEPDNPRDSRNHLVYRARRPEPALAHAPVTGNPSPDPGR